MYLLDYNLIFSTVFDFLNMILYDSNPKILYSCKSILYSFIENDSFLNYNLFSIAIAVYKYSRSITGIYKNNYYNKYFNQSDIEEIENPQVNQSYKLKANIHDENGNLVKEGIVQFYMDGVDIGSIDLSNNPSLQSALGNDVLGAANPMFEYELGADNDLYINYIPTKAGKHTLTAVYEGTTIYKSSNSTTILDVSNSNTKETTITVADVNTVYNGGKLCYTSIQ